MTRYKARTHMDVVYKFGFIYLPCTTMSVCVREVSSEEDCKKVVDITAVAFPDEAASTHMSAHKWRELHLDDWKRQPWLWRHVGRMLKKLQLYSAARFFKIVTA